MLVDISYTVEIEDIPDRLRELYERDILEVLQKEVSLGGGVDRLTILLEESPPRLEEIREAVTRLSKELGKLQIRLRDIEAILKGYQKETKGNLQGCPWILKGKYMNG